MNQRELQALPESATMFNDTSLLNQVLDNNGTLFLLLRLNLFVHIEFTKTVIEEVMGR